MFAYLTVQLIKLPDNMPDRGWNTTQKWGKSSPANLQSWCQIPSVDL